MDDPTAPPRVEIRYSCGSERFHGANMPCGLVVAPCADPDGGTGIVVYLTGTPVEVVQMLLAALASTDGLGLRDTVVRCMQEGHGTSDETVDAWARDAP